MSDVAEQKKWLRETTHGLLKRFTKWRRKVKIGLVIFGALVAGAGAASVAANLVVDKWPLYGFQIFGLLMACVGGALMEFLDEGAADAINRANELAEVVDERDQDISLLGKDFEWITRLYATAAALRDMANEVISSGPGNEQAQRSRFGAMLDVAIADNVILFGMNSDRWNFAIYLFDSRMNVLNCLVCR